MQRNANVPSTCFQEELSRRNPLCKKGYKSMVPRLANCMSLTNWDDCVVAPDSTEDIILGDGLIDSWSCKRQGIIKFPHNLEKLYNILVRKTNENLFTYFEGIGAWGLESSRLRTWRSRTPGLIPLNIFKQVTLMIGFLASFPHKMRMYPRMKGKKCTL